MIYQKCITMDERAAGLPELPLFRTAVSFRPALQQLNRQRKETAALRELWHSLSEKRQKLQHSLKASSGLESEATKTNEPKNNGEDTDIRPSNREDCAGTQPPVNDKVTAEGAGNSQSLPSISGSFDVITNLPRPDRSTFAPSPLKKTSLKPHALKSRHQQVDVTSSRSIRHNDVKSPLPYHTAITRRPDRKCSPSFQALTHYDSSPLPQLMEGGVSRSYTAVPSPRRDIREWQNEIVKVVPARPDFVRPSPLGVSLSKVRTLRYPYKVINFDPACHFYRSWSKVTDKDYVINPEWSSEKRLLQSGLGPRANTELSLRHNLRS